MGLKQEAGNDRGKNEATNLREGYRSLLGKNKLHIPYSTFKCELAVGIESQSLETFETRLGKASENILLDVPRGTDQPPPTRRSPRLTNVCYLASARKRNAIVELKPAS